ncbi:hypothetical protein BH09PAT1_BH09PAT1_7820 [soil metagenome]
MMVSSLLFVRKVFLLQQWTRVVIIVKTFYDRYMLNVIKADGSQEPYSDEKVVKSIKRAGIPEKLQVSVLKSIKSKLYDNIPTYDIYGFINDALANSQEPYSKSRYSLKQSIMMLGPTGYPFEDFMGRIFSEHGYKVQTRQILNGRCVTHEIDVIAEKDGKKILIEAKFHNNPGTRSDVHIPLYVHSRFEDLKDRYKFDEAWIVTNTKTTTDADTYANCNGMNIISWNSPEKGSLRDLIEEKNLHPVTMLTTLTTQQKAQLLANHIIMCKDLIDNHKNLALLSLAPEEMKLTLTEAEYICSNSHNHSA